MGSAEVRLQDFFPFDPYKLEVGGKKRQIKNFSVALIV